LRKRHHSANDDECEHDGNASTQARHGRKAVYADGTISRHDDVRSSAGVGRTKGFSLT
jgi:hypothetical protein